jgi:hypothetical protein
LCPPLPQGVSCLSVVRMTKAIFHLLFSGEALLDSGIRVTAVFASPALRCVQTAKHILEGR